MRGGGARLAGGGLCTLVAETERRCNSRPEVAINSWRKAFLKEGGGVGGGTSTAARPATASLRDLDDTRGRPGQVEQQFACMLLSLGTEGRWVCGARSCLFAWLCPVQPDQEG